MYLGEIATKSTKGRSHSG